MPSLRALALLLAALALTAAGCGGSDDDKDKQSSAPAPAETTPEATETEAAPSGESGKTVAVSNAKDLSSKPKLGKPQGDPPGELVTKDLVEGKGAAAKSGDTVTVQYVGISWSTGEQFDASWDRSEPFSFPLGQGQVIQGWDNGVAGMKEGGRRELVIPPDQGYGAQGAPPDIAPNETLVFVVDLKRIG
jgi:peptidylprolyl isomerase